MKIVIMKSSNQIAITLFAIVLGLSFKGTAQTVQYVTLYSTNSITGFQYPLQTNQIVSVVGYDWAAHPSVSGQLALGGSVNLFPYFTENSVGFFGSQIPQIVTGLTNAIVVRGVDPAWVTLQITTPASATIISNYVPADAIVIPASATGNVQIILESSPDLVNWTAANPGIYGASAGTNRFFRVRAAAY